MSGLYLGILIMAVPILYLSFKDGTNEYIEDRNRAVTIAQNTMDKLYNQNLTGKENLDNLPGIYKNSSHTYQIETKKLSFNIPSNSGIYPILIARKNVDDGTIEVCTYITTQFVGEVDYTKYVSPPIVTFQNGTLSFEPTHQSLHFIQCNADFTVNQFKNPYREDENGLSNTFGDKIVFIRVPKNAEIDNGENHIQIINSN